MEPQNRAASLATIRAVLAADCACSAAAFTDDELLITPAEERPGRRRYPLPAKQLLVVTMGRGVVVSCDSGWIDPVRAILDGQDRDAVFAAVTIAELARIVDLAGVGETLRGPVVRHACAPESFRLAPAPAGIAIDVFEGEDVIALYHYQGFVHALSYQPNHPRPDVAAAVARRGKEIVGIAGMSADCDTMWQIGIDVVKGARGAGIGQALVAELTALAFRRGRVPYYTYDVANLRSHALAASLGYWPAWIEMYARGP